MKTLCILILAMTCGTVLAAEANLTPHPNLMWERRTPFDRYKVEIASDDTFRELVLNDSIENVARYVPSKPMAPGSYVWRATGEDGVVQAGQCVIAKPRHLITIPAGSGLADIEKAVADAEPYSLLRFEKGSYDIRPADGSTALFDLRDKQHLLIDGNGSEFMIHGIISIVNVLRCKDITLRNFTVDYDAPIRTSVKVTKVDKAAGALTATLLPGHPKPEDHPERFWTTHTAETAMLIDPARYSLAPMTDNCTASEVPWKPLGEGRYRIKLTSKGKSRIMHMRPGLIYTMGPRGPAGFEISLSENITLNDITTLMVPGIGISAAFASDLKVLGLKLTRRKDRALAVQNGGTNLRSARIGVWMENCFFESTGDDMNHNNTLTIQPLEQPAPDTVIASTLQAGTHYKPKGLDIQTGDRFLFFNRKQGCIIAKAKIVNVEMPEEYGDEKIRLQFDQPLPTLSLAPRGSRLSRQEMETITQMHPIDRVAGSFVFRNNRFERGRRIGIFTKGGPGLISGNHLAFMGGPGIDAWNDPWGSFKAQDTLIKGNTIISPCISANAGDPGIRFMVLSGTSPGGGKPLLYDNIRIVGNRIVNPPRYGISFEDGRNIVIKDNQIEISDRRLRGAKAVHTARIKNLALEGNSVTDLTR
jgi:hypothetical protein